MGVKCILVPRSPGGCGLVLPSLNVDAGHHAHAANSCFFFRSSGSRGQRHIAAGRPCFRPQIVGWPMPVWFCGTSMGHSRRHENHSGSALADIWFSKSSGWCNRRLGSLVEEGGEALGWGVEFQGGSGPAVECVLDAFEVGFGVATEVGALFEPEPQQPVGVLVAATLPG